MAGNTFTLDDICKSLSKTDYVSDFIGNLLKFNTIITEQQLLVLSTLSNMPDDSRLDIMSHLIHHVNFSKLDNESKKKHFCDFSSLPLSTIITILHSFTTDTNKYHAFGLLYDFRENHISDYKLIQLLLEFDTVVSRFNVISMLEKQLNYFKSDAMFVSLYALFKKKDIQPKFVSFCKPLFDFKISDINVKKLSELSVDMDCYSLLCEHLKVPKDTMEKYANDLKLVTKGKFTKSMEFTESLELWETIESRMISTKSPESPESTESTESMKPINFAKSMVNIFSQLSKATNATNDDDNLEVITEA